VTTRGFLSFLLSMRLPRAWVIKKGGRDILCQNDSQKSRCFGLNGQTLVGIGLSLLHKFFHEMLVITGSVRSRNGCKKLK